MKEHVHLTENTIIQGIFFQKDDQVQYYPSGKLYSCLFNSDSVAIQNLPVAKLTFIYFHETGKIAHCIIGQDTKIQGVQYPSKSFINFHEDGTLDKTRSGLSDKSKAILP